MSNYYNFKVNNRNWDGMQIYVEINAEKDVIKLPLTNCSFTVYI